ncbi:MAG: hypothetical protein QXY62_04565 [Candidatus Altiarchaeota archaeon]
MKYELIHTTKEGIKILVSRGKKRESPYDFRVWFKEPNKRFRTPKHVHLIVELYVKQAFNSRLTFKLRDHLLRIFDLIKPIEYYPPKLQVYRSEHAEEFKELDKVGEFTVEFLLVVTELIMIQEKTNYPAGSLTQRLYYNFGRKDRFSVISSAVFRGRK